MVKEPTEAVINFTTDMANIIQDPTNQSRFSVSMDFSELFTRPATYRIDPFGDRINITLADLDTTFNMTNANLTSVRVYRGTTWVPPEVTADHVTIGGTTAAGYPALISSDENVTLSLEPGYFIGKASETSVMEIRFFFQDFPPRTTVNGTFLYNYATVPVPPLQPAVMEVAVW